MKVALVGAPTSGKTRVANALVKRLEGDDHWTTVDKYVDKLNELIGWDTPATNYAHEVQIIGARWTAEDKAKNKSLNTITCGSIFETIVYASSVQPWGAYEQTLVEDQIYLATMMGAFGALSQKTYDYELVFYLPWPEDRAHEHSWNAVVNAKLPECLVGLGVPFIKLTGTNKERTNAAFEAITTYREATLPSDDEQRV